MILNSFPRSVEGVSGNKNVRKAVYGFHVADCRYPYHFREWLRDCPGYKVYLILADFARCV